MAEEFVVDPRGWITPPYQTCPFCRAEGDYGVLMIHAHGYVRRCRSCMKDERFSLPPVSKKLVYLDQFAISKLTFALHPDHRERLERQGAGEAVFWRGLFERLDRLVKLQLIACPSSLSHWEESLPARSYEELRRMYEHLSADVSYKDLATIKRFQLHREFRRWLGKDVEDVTVNEITTGALDGWTDRIQISVMLDPDQGELDEMLEARQRKHAGLAAVVERWRTEPRRTFAEYFEDELAVVGPAELTGYWKWVQRSGQIAAGAVPYDMNALMPPTSAYTMSMLKDVLEERGVPRDQVMPKITEFARSEAACRMPWARIACGMLAALAVKASLQQAPTPDQGTVTDIDTVATLLPYCDAIFIDNRCAELLRTATEEIPLDCQAAVFSTSSRNELLTWLDEVEAGASPEHLALVEEVYGPEWGMPYTTMFESRGGAAP